MVQSCGTEIVLTIFSTTRSFISVHLRGRGATHLTVRPEQLGLRCSERVLSCWRRAASPLNNSEFYPMIIGITGGPGAGKTTLMKKFMLRHELLTPCHADGPFRSIIGYSGLFFERSVFVPGTYP